MTDPVDALFVGALDEFVKRRDALVRALKQGGDKDTAAAVKALRKPSTAAWAVNQVARRNPDAIDELITAARAVHDAQAAAVQGRDTGGLRRATEAWRTQIRALAGDVAKEAGEQYRDDAAGTFEAASTSDEWAPVLKAGRLMTTLSPSGFGLQDMPDPVLTRPTLEDAPDPAPARDAAAIEAARAHLEKLDAAFEKATHSLRRAEQRLDQARTAVEEAEAARTTARAERDAAARALAEIEQ